MGTRARGQAAAPGVIADRDVPFEAPPVDCHAGVLYWARLGKTKVWIAAKYGLTVGQVSYVLASARGRGEAVEAVPGIGVVVPLRRAALPVDSAMSATVMLLLGRGAGRCAWVLGPVAGAETFCCGALVARGKRGEALPYCLDHCCLAYLPRREPRKIEGLA